MTELGDTISLDYFEKLDPDVRQVVLQLRSDLRALDLDIEGRKKRTAGRDETRRRLVAEWPDQYCDDTMTEEAFDHLMLLADTWVVTEELIAEKEAQRAEDHPDGKWTLDQLRTAMAAAKPQTYGRWTNAQWATTLRNEGIEIKTIRIGNTTAKGFRKADLDRLMEAREDRRKGVTRP